MSRLFQVAWQHTRAGFLRLEDKPLVVVLVAAGATVATALVLASYAGWPRVLHRADARHSWGWLAVCLLGELVAYLGYVLTIRDMARVDDGPEMDMAVSTKTVVAGFGVFAATRSSGGFAVDYWAFRRAGAGKRDAVSRVLALGFLEYAVLRGRYGELRRRCRVGLDCERAAPAPPRGRRRVLLRDCRSSGGHVRRHMASLGSGDYMNVPRGTVHSFRNGVGSSEGHNRLRAAGLRAVLPRVRCRCRRGGSVRDLSERGDDRAGDRGLRAVRHDPRTDVGFSALSRIGA
jgi:hypothetical protein